MKGKDSQGEDSLIGATRSRGMRWRRSKSRRSLRKPSKRSRPSPPEPIYPIDHDEFAEVEETDRLLLSALRYWEVERDLMEERVAAMTSVSTGL
ncbi:MAG: hypothetical protein DME74_10500 [Verrucomicrobia bacterium]|nr:MAG: hypothetical protein DME74_10500 [Verrucomicrobiota bacterium]